MKKPSRKTLKRNLDRITSQIIRARDNYQCQKCKRIYTPENNRGSLDHAHVFGRERLSMRWDLINGIALCCGCHKNWHDNPIESFEWFSHKYPYRYAYLCERRKQKPRPIKDAELMVMLAQAKQKLAELKE